MWVRFAVLVVLAYLVGAINPAYLAAKIACGIDLRDYGTRNTGLSNLYHATGKKKAILAPVIIFDVAKSWPLLWAASALGLGFSGEAAVAVAVIAGHNWPVYLGFRGGRGMLATLGIGLAWPLVTHLLPPWPLMVGGVILLVGMFGLRSAPLGVGAAVFSLPITSRVVEEPLAINLGYLGIVLAMIIRRLVQPRREISAHINIFNLLLNRLLFDRDIRDRDAWLAQTVSPEPSGARGKG